MIVRMKQSTANRLVKQLERDYPEMRPRKWRKPERKPKHKSLVERLAQCDEPAEHFGATKPEAMFAERAMQKRGRVYRNGWPDFLVELPDRTIGVEVKATGDEISDAQAKMFQALERLAVRVYIWNPKKPSILTPWRKHLERAVQRGPSTWKPRRFDQTHEVSIESGWCREKRRLDAVGQKR